MAAGTRLTHSLFAKLSRLGKSALKKRAHSEFLRHACAHCEIFAAAANSGVSPHHLLGLAGKEASYCKNIGKGIAYVEASNRLNEEIKKGASQATIIWWNLQLESLKKIAEQLGMDVMEIPGSVGAGALSCLAFSCSHLPPYETELSCFKNYNSK